ncbi:DUF1987 domain-containing protein [Eisenibacter elegans]|jgi:hypothetical protein|uniref:DUF1987 domain-containing protein n=1 Tax=Eisenibacter elegans TaxID=997 RepID=UPI00041A264F|nr:DUF1987 domain-containing protein [Eisenibacter elegans]
MENIHIEGTARSPYVHFNAETGELEISGRSIPEHAINFYKPLLDWLEQYMNNPKLQTKMVFNLEYFNTASSKCILDLLRQLEKVQETNKTEVSVKWFYDDGDEDMEESGNDFKSLINLNIELHSK